MFDRAGHSRQFRATLGVKHEPMRQHETSESDVSAGQMGCTPVLCGSGNLNSSVVTSADGCACALPRFVGVGLSTWLYTWFLLVLDGVLPPRVGVGISTTSTRSSTDTSARCTPTLSGEDSQPSGYPGSPRPDPVHVTAMHSDLVAHSPGVNGQWHLLRDHLRDTAELARRFAEPWGGDDLAAFIGLSHDLDKYKDEWQDALRAVVRGERTKTGVPHAAGGGTLGSLLVDGEASVETALLHALLVRSHHSGLRNMSGAVFESLRAGMRGDTDEIRRIAESDLGLNFGDVAADVTMPSWFPERLDLDSIYFGKKRLTGDAARDAITVEMFARMTFSTLVDADWSDTDAHFRSRPLFPEAELDAPAVWARFQEQHANSFNGPARHPMDRLRNDLFDNAVAAALSKPGFYSLDAPVGSGKTLAGMAFALRHAAEHQKRRIIVAVPYTTITTQNAAVYRRFLDPDNTGRVVLENHSGILSERVLNDPWRRGVSSNWNAPVIVTTDVQLLESLHDYRTGAVRKLHRIANSVIILDETQSLPVSLLPTILETLRELVDHYGVTVLFSSATPPNFSALPVWQGIDITHIDAPDPNAVSSSRVDLVLPTAGEPAKTWKETAALVDAQPQTLSILNTIASVNSLIDELRALGAPHVRAFTARLCGIHRTRVLADAQQRLAAGDPIHLVATIAIQAGVDISFPWGLRELAGLVDILQALGRINRHAALATATLLVTEIEGSRNPSAESEIAARITRRLFIDGDYDPSTPEGLSLYFRELYAALLRDGTGQRAAEIAQLRHALAFESVADAFTMIDSEYTTPVLITDYGTSQERAAVAALVEALSVQDAKPTNAQQGLIQQFSASAPNRVITPSTTRELSDGTLVWLGEYDSILGVVVSESRDF